MTGRISKESLKKLRNHIPIEKLISEVFNIPSKHSDGYFRFLCPVCHDFNTAAKKETNLARCFRCNKNFNTIDLVMLVQNYTFLQTIDFLTNLLPHINRTK